MTDTKKAAKAGGREAAFLVLDGKGAGPFDVPNVPSPAGGWIPGKPVSLDELGIDLARAQEIVKSTGLFSLKGD